MHRKGSKKSGRESFNSRPLKIVFQVAEILLPVIHAAERNAMQNKAIVMMNSLNVV